MVGERGGGDGGGGGGGGDTGGRRGESGGGDGGRGGVSLSMETTIITSGASRSTMPRATLSRRKLAW